jgi:hypothetical protein
MRRCERSHHPRFWRYYAPAVLTATFLMQVWEMTRR